MNRSGAYEIAVLAIVFAFIATVFGLGVAFISETNQQALGHWFDENDEKFWPFLIGAVPAIATYLLGRSAGRKSGKTEAYSSAIGTAEGAPDASAVVVALRKEAKDHNLTVTA